MNIKSLLIGSAAALAAVSGAQAADAIVAAEPEPMEYVRVCDAFGTGYFYIPGTETCLQISGYVRFQVDINEDAVGNDSGYKVNTRGYLSLDAKSDTELGALTGHIDLETNSGDGAGGQGHTHLDGAWIQLGGFKAGYFYTEWDKGINGETDVLDGGILNIIGGQTLLNAVSYQYDGGAFSARVALESFANNQFAKFDDGLGVSGVVTGSFGAVSADLLGSYDFDEEDGAIRGLISADLGPGTLQAAAVWSSGASRYWDSSEWSVAASYKAQLSEKLSITPGAQYFGTIDYDASGDYRGSRDAWRAGVTLDYNIVTNLDLKTTVNYIDVDNVRGGPDLDNWSGFVRLQRSF